MTARKFTDEEELVICREYIDKLSISKLANKYSVCGWTIHNLLKRWNVKRRSVGEGRKYHCNDNFFDEINSEEKAYWLGFIEGDGYINNQYHFVRITLAIKDKLQIEKFIKSVKSDHKIYEYNRNRNKKIWTYSIICIHSKQMVKSLLKYKKNGFDSISDKLKRHFIRGLFDADGCIHKSKDWRRSFSIVGKPFLIREIHEYLIGKLDVKRTKLQNLDPIVSLRHSSKKDIKKIYNFLYKDATIFMERKYKIFLDIVS